MNQTLTSGLALVLLLAYPWAATASLIGNLTLVDGLAGVAAIMIVLHGTSLWRLVTLYGRTPYGWSAFFLTVVLALSLFRSRDPAEGVLLIGQMLFSWHVLVPALAVLLASSNDPVRIVRAVGTFYVCLFFVGWIFAHFFGMTALVSYSGALRVFARWDGMVFWWIAALVPRLTALGLGHRFTIGDAIVVLLSSFVAIAIASRALLLGLGVAVLYTLWLLARGGRGRAGGMIVGSVVMASITAFALNIDRLAAFGMAARYAGEGNWAGDHIRGTMYRNALDVWLSSVDNLLLGTGSQLYSQGQVVHNVLLQIGVFAGVLGVTLVLLFILCPVVIAGRSEVLPPPVRHLPHVVRLNVAMLMPWMLTHPIQGSRWYWCYIGAIVGIALHAFLVRHAEVRPRTLALDAAS